jgi:hypothetical protein
MSLSKKGQLRSPRELIISVRSGQSFSPGVDAPEGADRDLAQLLAREGARLRPVLEQRIRSGIEAVDNKRNTLGRYHRVLIDDAKLDDFRKKLEGHPALEAAYIKPPSGPPVVPSDSAVAQGIAADAVQAPVTPDYSGRQIYLGPAPAGIDASFAWTRPGGRGNGINIIDCEWSWNFQHEDLQNNCRGVVVGAQSQTDVDHGTAVIGTLVASDNGFGTIGICANANVATAVFPDDGSGSPTSTIILQAADLLNPGDILLLEIHRPGPPVPPANGPAVGNTQAGYVAIEWWPDDFDAIAYATSKGILVVEAAGNGGENLDDPGYNVPGAGFPASWRNPFAAGGPNSGAILVGAGNPPAGTHGRAQDSIGFGEAYCDRARCAFSNYGSRIDCQGWGFEVTGLSYGDLNDLGPNRVYTDIFAGTSSASPMIAGGLACIQGALRAKGAALLNASSARVLLRQYGVPQQDAPGRPATENIGNRPDLRRIFAALQL